MNAIRIRKHLDSETLHLPEPKELMGHDVEITIEEASPAAGLTPEQSSQEFFVSPALKNWQGDRDLGAHGYVPILGALADAGWEGFDETLEQWRKEGPSETDGEG